MTHFYCIYLQRYKNQITHGAVVSGEQKGKAGSLQAGNNSPNNTTPNGVLNVRRNSVFHELVPTTTYFQDTS